MIYILDTNVISDRINQLKEVERRMTTALQSGDTLYLCQPVYYEVLRGLLWVNAVRKQQIFETLIIPALDWLTLTNEDWRRAAQLWAEARKNEKQLADTDLVIAAVSLRLKGVVVSSDDDFDALPITRENWRI